MGEAMAGSIKLSVDSDLDLVVLVAKGVRGVCSELVPEEDVDAIERSVVEAVNNVIKHGYDNDRGHNVEVSLKLHPDRIIVDIVDHAAPMDRNRLDEASSQQFDFDVSDLSAIPEGGMGLALIRMSMDKVEYRSGRGGNRLRMTKRIAAKAVR